MDALRRPWVWVCVLAALLVRVPAVSTLPIDWDEPIYMEAAQALMDAFHAGAWPQIFTPSLNPEHPGLVKLIYATGFSFFGEDPDLIERLIVVRGVSLVAGVLMVALAAMVHPAAGMVLATHTIHAKYSCEGYLDSLPALWMALALLLAWKNRRDVAGSSIVLCGCLWGAAIAGKWIHGIPGVLILFVWADWRSTVRLVVVAVAATVLLDPTMWASPVDRVVQMVRHHQAYASTVPDSSMWTPWITLAGGGPAVWHPEIFPWSVDGAWLALGLLGIGMGLRRPWGRYLAAWFSLPMVVLMTWETRWPQHLMVVVMPLSLGVAVALAPLISRASHRFGPSDSHPPTSV